MGVLKINCLIFGILFLLVACHPQIYVFKVNPKTIGADDTIRVSWKVKGIAVLKIADINYPGTPATSLAPLSLLLTLDGKTTTLKLHADSAVKIPLSGEDSLTVVKKPDSILDDRLRYITLVVSRNGQDSSRVIQVAVRPDSAKDEIAFRTIIRGDSLVATGVNNPVRWGNSFDILAVSDASKRDLDVFHSNIKRHLHPGDPPDKGFQGTPVKGSWSFCTLMTEAEKNNHRIVPNFLKLSITLKHH